MAYNKRILKDIKEKYQRIGPIHDKLMLQLGALHSKLSNHQAKEYLMQGAGRRLCFITRCIDNIFRIFPVGQTEKLAIDELTDIGINLHAFFINIAGLFDNFGWVFAYEYDLLGAPKDGKLKREDIGLFNRKTQLNLPEALRTYLQADYLQTWYSDYSKNYRDALAHRVPLYVPPSVLSDTDHREYLELEAQLQTLDLSIIENFEIYDGIIEEQMKLGQASPFFAHSLGEKDQPIFLHAQLIADFTTIEEIVKMFCTHFQKT